MWEANESGTWPTSWSASIVAMLMTRNGPIRKDGMEVKKRKIEKGDIKRDNNRGRRERKIKGKMVRKEEGESEKWDMKEG